MSELRNEHDIAVVELGSSYDSLDDALITGLRDMLFDKIDRLESPYLILDMSATDYIGSSFIEVIFRAWKRLHERGGQLALCGVDENCSQVLSTTRVDTLIETFPDRAAAQAAMQSR